MDKVFFTNSGTEAIEGALEQDKGDGQPFEGLFLGGGVQ